MSEQRIASLAAIECAEVFLENLIESVTEFEKRKDASPAAGCVLLGSIRNDAVCTYIKFRELTHPKQ